MVNSMTGYGRSELADKERKVTAEMKSVNNRYLDVNIRLPRRLNFLESAVREELKRFIRRGKVDLFLTCDDLTEGSLCLKYNRALAMEYGRCLKQLAQDLEVPFSPDLAQIAQLPEVFAMEEQAVDAEALWPLLKRAIDEAGAAFAQSRAREGLFLQKDLTAKLDELETHVRFVEEKAPALVAAYRENLFARVGELMRESTPDEGRLLQEVTIYADKVCVDEELVRLRSHIEAMRSALAAGEAVGRRLDFLAQEMNREANTILSKSDDLEASAHAIEMKTGIEKIREQIQNIE